MYEYATSEGMLPPAPEDDKKGLNMSGGCGNEWGGGAWNNDDSMVLSPRLMNESSVVPSHSSHSTTRDNEPPAQLPGVSTSGMTAALSSKEAPTMDAGVRVATPASSSPLKQRRCVVPTRTHRSIYNVGVRLPRSPPPPNQRPQGGGIGGGSEGRGGGGAVDAVGAPLFTVPRKRGFPTTNLWRRTNDYRSWEAEVPLWK